MKLFWDRGYEGTSFDDLIAAMGISPSSLCNAFGSKERLYQEAAMTFATKVGQWFALALAGGPDTRAAFRNLLTTATRELTRDDMPKGCMISLAATHGPPELAPLHELMAGYRRAAEDAMAARIQRGIAEGDVAEGTDAEALARFYSVVARGMAVQARDGTARQRLLEVVDVAMRAWPADPQAKSATSPKAAASRGAPALLAAARRGKHNRAE